MINVLKAGAESFQQIKGLLSDMDDSDCSLLLKQCAVADTCLSSQEWAALC